MANKEATIITIENLGVDVKRKSIKDKVRREVFEVDESLAIENSQASYFQVKRTHVNWSRIFKKRNKKKAKNKQIQAWNGKDKVQSRPSEENTT
ncbi:hypothetical protein Tco_0238088 [Tanacetum coccineum]